MVFLIHDRVELPRCPEHALLLRGSLLQSLPARAWREKKPPAREGAEAA